MSTELPSLNKTDTLSSRTHPPTFTYIHPHPPTSSSSALFWPSLYRHAEHSGTLRRFSAGRIRQESRPLRELLPFSAQFAEVRWVWVKKKNRIWTQVKPSILPENQGNPFWGSPTFDPQPDNAATSSRNLQIFRWLAMFPLRFQVEPAAVLPDIHVEGFQRRTDFDAFREGAIQGVRDSCNESFVRSVERQLQANHPVNPRGKTPCETLLKQTNHTKPHQEKYWQRGFPCFPCTI